MFGVSGSGLWGGESPKRVFDFVQQTGITFPVLLEDDTLHEYGDAGPGISPYPLDVVVDRAPGAHLLEFPSLTHFGPLQDPIGVAEAMRALIQDL